MSEATYHGHIRQYVNPTSASIGDEQYLYRENFTCQKEFGLDGIICTPILIKILLITER